MADVSISPRARLNALSLYGLAGLSLAVTVHFGSYLGYSVGADQPLFWGLHVGMFPLFFVFVMRLRAWQSPGTGAFGLPRRQLRWRELLRYLPAWVPPLVVLLFVYVMANFFFSVGHLPPKGTPSTMTPAQAMYTTRAFSGHWLVFYAVPTLYFLFVPADARPTQDAAGAPA